MCTNVYTSPHIHTPVVDTVAASKEEAEQVSGTQNLKPASFIKQLLILKIWSPVIFSDRVSCIYTTFKHRPLHQCPFPSTALPAQSAHFCRAVLRLLPWTTISLCFFISHLCDSFLSVPFLLISFTVILSSFSHVMTNYMQQFASCS